MTRPRDIADGINRIDTSAADATAITIDANENVGIGTTSPLNKLDLAEAGDTQLRITSTDGNNVRLGLNSSGTVYNWIEANGTNLLFAVGNAERMRINSSGNVGIGVVPETWLSSYDALQIGASGSIAGISSGNENVSISSNAYIATDGNYKYIATNEASRYLQSAGVHYFSNVASGTADTNITWNDRMVIDASGNVGIGTSSPLAAGSSYTVVDIGSASTASLLNMTDNGTETGRIVAQDDQLHLSSGTASGFIGFRTGGFSSGNESMRIDSSGNVGVGTSSPMVINGTTFSSGNHLHHTSSTHARFVASGGSSGQILLNDTGASTDQKTKYIMSDGGFLRFGKTSDAGSNTEQMRITNGGQANMGDNPSLDADQDLSAQGQILALTLGGTFGEIPVTTNCGSFTTTYAHMRFYNGNGLVGNISTSGSSTTYSGLSDYRLKENVTNITDGITRLKQLNPSRFNFIADADTTFDGFLAHEAQTVVPEAVTGTHNEVETWTQEEIDAGDAPANTSAGDNKLDSDGNTIPVYQGIDQSKLVPLLTAALQEAITKIETLEAKVTALENA